MSETTTTTTPLMDAIRQASKEEDSRMGRLNDVLREAIRQYMQRTRDAMDDALVIKRAMDSTIDSLRTGNHCSTDMVGNSRQTLNQALAARQAAAAQITQMCYALDLPTDALFAEIKEMI